MCIKLTGMLAVQCLRAYVYNLVYHEKTKRKVHPTENVAPNGI
jgi:hypothetical protein